METNNLLSSSISMQQGRKSTKKIKTKKIKPVKVVYISNPMKVKTSAAEFRALVQELTGQDAEFPDSSKKFPAAAAIDNDHDQVVNDDSPKMRDIDHGDADADADAVLVDSSSNEQPESSGSTALYDPNCFDDAFMPQMLDTISGVFPAALLYHSPQ